MSQFLGSALAALVAWYFAKALDVPVWREGFSWDVTGDRCDIAVLTFFAVFLLSGSRS